MLLAYHQAPKSGSLRQGEILANVWEHVVVEPPLKLEDGHSPSVKSVLHSRVIVLSAACDLERDFLARFSEQSDQPERASEGGTERSNAFISYILLCDMYEEGELKKVRNLNSKLWKMVRKNQNERYHHLKTASIRDDPLGTELPDMYLDFKKVLAFPVESLYEGLNRGTLVRVAIVPEVYIHDLIHRFYSYLSRIGVPDEPS